MRRSITHVVRFVAALAVLGVFLPMLQSPATGVGSPYSSALVNLFGSVAHAQGCSFRKCRFDAPEPYCNPTLINSNCLLGQGQFGCQSELCE